MYDALTHARVYRPALTESEVLKIMAGGRETHFEPLLLDVFFILLPELACIIDDVPDEQPCEQKTLEIDLLPAYQAARHVQV